MGSGSAGAIVVIRRRAPLLAAASSRGSIRPRFDRRRRFAWLLVEADPESLRHVLRDVDNRAAILIDEEERLRAHHYVDVAGRCNTVDRALQVFEEGLHELSLTLPKLLLALL